MALADVLKRHLSKQGVADTRVAWSERLKVDAGTLSKIVNGQLPFTRSRAKRWAANLYPDQPALQGELVNEMLASLAYQGPSVSQFCDRVVTEGGGVPAERIDELFTALCAETNPLVCVVYCDMPRAAPDAKYHGLGRALAKAISNGLNFAMFLPFIEKIPEAPDLGEFDTFAEMMRKRGDEVAPAARTAAFMQEITEATRGAFLAFQSDAIAELDNTSDARQRVKERLRLYEATGSGISASGFGGKMFYIQWDDGPIFHKRIFEWVSTPTRDWLLYRGDANIHPDALRDSFYPVPHMFDMSIPEQSGIKTLPSNIDPRSDSVCYEALWRATPGFRHTTPGAWKLSKVCK